ncbi:hypothetical protein [Thermomicrobium sp.]
MRQLVLALLAPCRLGWLIVALAIAVYGFSTGQWALLIVALAPLLGTLAALLITRHNPSCTLAEEVRSRE